MPQFGIKSLLIVFAVFALWLSTFFVSDPTALAIGVEIRKCVLLGILLASGCAAVCYRGNRRAFWLGFFVATLILIQSSRLFPTDYAPNLRHAVALCGNYFATRFDISQITQVFIEDNLRFAVTIALCTLAGSITAVIYNQSQKTSDG